MPKVAGEAQGRISGRIIIEQLVRNMELGQFEMAYSILAPCLFSLYLHPDDYARLTGVFELIREDARRALLARLETLNAKPMGLGVLRGGKERKPYKIACQEWTFEFFPDSEGVVPLGDVEIHSELNETPQPGYHGPRRGYTRGNTPVRRTRVRRDSLRRRLRAAIVPDDPERNQHRTRRRWRAGEPGAVHQRRGLP
jgi:hypothetical protein